MSTLGVLWDTSADMLRIRNVQVPQCSTFTKRCALQTLARVFDPLGFFSPVTVQGKILLQKIWSSKGDWDEEVNDPELVQDFQDFKAQVLQLELHPIPRFPFLGGGAVSTIHVFCDSSNNASAVCVYLVERSSSASFSNLVLSKTKVVPIKFPEAREEDLRIPRKELVACLMGAKLGRRVADTLSISPESVFHWTDSSICLGWIRNLRDKTPVFVKNRVKQINSLSSAESWRHLSTHDNAADIPSRGMSIEELSNSDLWKHGPCWLTMDEEHWPSKIPFPQVDVLCVSSIEDSVEADEIEADPTSELLFDLSRYSDLPRAIRVVSCFFDSVHQWFRYLASSPSSIQKLDRDDPLLFLVRQEQKIFFAKEFRALSKGDQLPKNSPLRPLRPTWDSMQSIIVSVGREKPAAPLVLLPKQSQLSRLVLLEYHSKTFHGGTETTLGRSREKFWIINGRVISKQLIRKCPICKIFSSNPYLQVESALPALRTTPAPPFQFTGCDYAGPFYLRNNQKAYVLLFTCGVVRALHIELVPDLTAASFMDAFRRFQSRRSSPRVMLSDNALTFRQVAKLLPSIQWQFIPERSPWWAGFYERLVKSIKSALKKTLGKSLVSFRELETLVTEIEDSINSRPLTLVSDDIDCPQPLTPNHFVKPSLSFSDFKMDEQAPFHLRKIWNNRQRILRHFWLRWKAEYLVSLRLWRQQKVVGSIKPSVGDLVLLEVSGKGRNHWPLGIIHLLIKGKDGFPRAAIVKVSRVDRSKSNLPVSTVFFRRPTKLLYPLETSILSSSVPLPRLPFPPSPSTSEEVDATHLDSVSSSKEESPMPSHKEPVKVSSYGRTLRQPGHLKDFF